MSRFFSGRYSSLEPYVPGEQPRERKYIKLNTNESPFPPSAAGAEAAAAEYERLMLYPDPTASELKKIFATLKSDNYVCLVLDVEGGKMAGETVNEAKKEVYYGYFDDDKKDQLVLVNMKNKLKTHYIPH